MEAPNLEILPYTPQVTSVLDTSDALFPRTYVS